MTARLLVLSMLFWLTPARGETGACASALQRSDLRAQAEAAARQPPSQVERLWTALVLASRSCEDSGQEIDALARRTEALRELGATDLAIISAREWRERALELDAGLDAARAGLRLGQMLSLSGQFSEADEVVEQARQLFDLHGSAEERARAFSELSRLERRRSNYLESLRYEQVALRLRNEDPARREAWRSLLSLAVLYEQVELFDESRKHYADALAAVEQVGTPRDIAGALASYAGFLNDFGGKDAPLALQMAERAVALERSFGDPAGMGSALLQVGRAHFALGELDKVEAPYREAFALAQTSHADALIAHLQFRWGELELARGAPDAALGRVENARNSYEKQGNRHRLIKVYALLEQIHLRRGDALAAANSGREHFRLRNEVLGAGATGKLGELLTNYALSEERTRNQLLRQENAVTELKLGTERRFQFYVMAFTLLLITALAVLTWRHRQARRLNHLLRQQSAEIEARRTELAQAHERLKAQSAQLYQSSITDPLTGLRNRAFGLNALRELLVSARSEGHKPVVMMFDIDNFKNINDHYGHLVGDRALERIAETLLMHAAPDALIARLGGEEFLYVLKDADRSSALFQAELLRRRIHEVKVEHEQGLLSVSASIGVCCVEDLGEVTVQNALRAADRALYQAKNAGRNCVRVA